MDCVYRGWADGRGEGEVGVDKPSIETQRTVLRIQYVALTDTKKWPLEGALCLMEFY